MAWFENAGEIWVPEGRYDTDAEPVLPEIRKTQFPGGFSGRSRRKRRWGGCGSEIPS